jgi:uncharacterized CHY-type Zn-finger protein
MFLIAGIQPRTRRVDQHPQRCPACGLMRAYTTRIDHYLSLFFIPLIRVKQGTPFLFCQACQPSMDDGLRSAGQAAAPSDGTVVCVACRQTFDGSFKYCPHCGQRA